MSENTHHLKMPYIMPAQAQKHVTHNEALRMLDAVTHLSVIASQVDDAPSTPGEGDRYIIGPNPNSPWDGKTDQIAEFIDGAWMYLEPQVGWLAWEQGADELLVFSASGWEGVSSGSQVDLLGINAFATTQERLVVQSESVLLNHDGANHRLKLNKANAADTASLIFQSGFSGRAEIGLIGDDAFQFKVSADGSTFNDAIRIEKGDGKVSLPGNGLGVLDRTMFLNLFPDSGRFQGNSSNNSLTGSYSAPSYLSGFNSSIISNYGEFTHNNSTYGGAGATLPAEVDLLVQEIRGTGNKRYGTEWCVLQISQGAGTASSLTIGSDTFYLSVVGVSVPVPEVQTYGFWIKVKNGKAIVSPSGNQSSISYNGIAKGLSIGAEHILQNSDGWVWIEVCGGDYAGLTYNQFVGTFRMTSGAACWYALPKSVPGDVVLGAFEVMPNGEVYGE